MTLSSDLAQALSMPRPTTDIAPRQFQPGVQYLDGKPSTIVTPDVPRLADGDTEAYAEIVKSMGVPLPEGAQLVLDKAWFNTAAWTREDKDDDNAVTRPAWRYAFRVVYDMTQVADPDWGKLTAAVRRRRRSVAQERRAQLAKGQDSMVVVLGDLQAGKTDLRGGTQELLERLDVALDDVVARAKEVRPVEILLLDAGDILEGFESAPNADRTNDLSQVQQIRLIRRIVWHWIQTLAPLAPKLIVAGVPSNHCRVRRGKQTLGDALDDYGIENIVACSELAAVNPEVYGHVQFVVPEEHRESLALKLVGGKILGLFHGHQKNSPEQFGRWLEGQALGRTPAGQADILVGGHFHQFRCVTVGDDRWIFVAPTMDAGSSWFTNNTGHDSRPGVLTFVVDDRGWKGLHIAWAG